MRLAVHYQIIGTSGRDALGHVGWQPVEGTRGAEQGEPIRQEGRRFFQLSRPLAAQVIDHAAGVLLGQSAE